MARWTDCSCRRDWPTLEQLVAMSKALTEMESTPEELEQARASLERAA
jgi:hypothetical protein